MYRNVSIPRKDSCSRWQTGNTGFHDVDVRHDVTSIFIMPPVRSCSGSWLRHQSKFDVGTSSPVRNADNASRKSWLRCKHATWLRLGKSPAKTGSNREGNQGDAIVVEDPDPSGVTPWVRIMRVHAPFELWEYSEYISIENCEQSAWAYRKSKTLSKHEGKHYTVYCSIDFPTRSRLNGYVFPLQGHIRVCTCFGMSIHYAHDIYQTLSGRSRTHNYS